MRECRTLIFLLLLVLGLVFVVVVVVVVVVCCCFLFNLPLFMLLTSERFLKREMGKLRVSHV